ncbi:hypothetical protein E2562_013556 [Oryza meyeriana var. granulata]|uniref:Uncharacterized protein n=1 Tax=Oryza meyeriana var. granulata TaxID=110450 RepID=A0A6G1D3L8_9ORYZ|nr:hypothetical protein E2562_013556 [Oryza meyeriana var. granulata]
MAGAAQPEEEPAPEAMTKGATHGTMVDPVVGAAAATTALVACGDRSSPLWPPFTSTTGRGLVS